MSSCYHYKQAASYEFESLTAIQITVSVLEWLDALCCVATPLTTCSTDRVTMTCCTILRPIIDDCLALWLLSYHCNLLSKLAGLRSGPNLYARGVVVTMIRMQHVSEHDPKKKLHY
jgi:hypothetical protein